MHLSSTELRDAHATFGTVETLLQRRRATYSAALELVTGSSKGDTECVDLLDSPVTRAHLGDVISGKTGYEPSKVVPVSRLVRGAVEFRATDARTYVVADPGAAVALDGAFELIAHEMGRVGAGRGGLRPISATRQSFSPASELVVEGLDLAMDLCPELAGDLLPHVVLIAIVEDDGDGHLVSASMREYPGLMVVPAPCSAVEVAEALIHEGAHQKFFDIALTRSILGGDLSDAPLFRASWAGLTAPAWPISQALAALHAYIGLAALMEAVTATNMSHLLSERSLLPFAESRAMEIGKWLLENCELLGPDGLRFLSLLTRSIAVGPSRSEANDLYLRPNVRTAVRPCGEWTLICQQNGPIDICWLPTVDAGAIIAEVAGGAR